jgi:hypothetical protein
MEGKGGTTEKKTPARKPSPRKPAAKTKKSA